MISSLPGSSESQEGFVSPEAAEAKIRVKIRVGALVLAINTDALTSDRVNSAEETDVVPLLFLQRHDVLVDLFSSFTGWPWLGKKASRLFVAA